MAKRGLVGEDVETIAPPVRSRPAKANTLRGGIVRTKLRAAARLRTRHVLPIKIAMLKRTTTRTAPLLLALVGCAFTRSPTPEIVAPEVLLREDFNGENDGRYQLNYTAFANWEVVEGSVDLVGTAPFDDFLPKSQGMYVDLDGTTQRGGTLRTRTLFAFAPGTYRLTLKMSGTPRPNQPANTVTLSVGDLFRQTVTLESYAPLRTYSRTFRVRAPAEARLTFSHAGGDDHGIFIDDIVLERL